MSKQLNTAFTLSLTKHEGGNKTTLENLKRKWRNGEGYSPSVEDYPKSFFLAKSHSKKKTQSVKNRSYISDRPLADTAQQWLWSISRLLYQFHYKQFPHLTTATSSRKLWRKQKSPKRDINLWSSEWFTADKEGQKSGSHVESSGEDRLVLHLLSSLVGITWPTIHPLPIMYWFPVQTMYYCKSIIAMFLSEMSSCLVHNSTLGFINLPLFPDAIRSVSNTSLSHTVK